MALQGYDDQLKDYISNVYAKKRLPFDLKHDLSGIRLLDKIQRNKFAKLERKLGATVLGKLFDKNIAIGEAKNEKEVKSEHVEKETKKPIDAYRDVLIQKHKQKTQKKY